MTIIIEWSTQATPVVVSSCVEQAGPRVQLPHDPLGIFSLFFDDNLVGMIVEETNHYAEQCLQESNKQWSTNAEEVRAYLILMGINRLPEIRDYWSTDKSLRYTPIGSVKTGSRRSRGTSTSSTMTSYLLVAKMVSHACRRSTLLSLLSNRDSREHTTPTPSSV